MQVFEGSATKGATASTGLVWAVLLRIASQIGIEFAFLNGSSSCVTVRTSTVTHEDTLTVYSSMDCSMIRVEWISLLNLNFIENSMCIAKTAELETDLTHPSTSLKTNN